MSSNPKYSSSNFQIQSQLSYILRYLLTVGEHLLANSWKWVKIHTIQSHFSCLINQFIHLFIEFLGEENDKSPKLWLCVSANELPVWLNVKVMTWRWICILFTDTVKIIYWFQATDIAVLQTSVTAERTLALKVKWERKGGSAEESRVQPGSGQADKIFPVLSACSRLRHKMDFVRARRVH